MYLPSLLLGLFATTIFASSDDQRPFKARSSSDVGYFTNFTTVQSKNLSFGKNYAVLNLDMINAIVGSINGTSNGRKFISATAKWIDAVHSKKPQPLQIFSRIYFDKNHPEIRPDTPFAKAGGALENVTVADPPGMVYPAFKPNEQDIQLQKTRYYAGTGNELELILSTQKIDTVVISGLRTSGVIMSSIYRLFDLNYNVYLIIDNCIEPPGGQADAQEIDQAIKQGIIPKLPANVITLDQALAALKVSG